MHPYENPLIKNDEFDRVVAAGWTAVVDYLMDWTPQSIAKAPREAFESALSGLEQEWLGQAVKAAEVIRDPNEVMPLSTNEEQRQACLRAWEEIRAFFGWKLSEHRREVLSEARSRLCRRAEKIKIRVFRDRIEIIDLLPNQQLYPYEQVPHPHERAAAGVRKQ
jgi:CHAT domain-containing protein